MDNLFLFLILFIFTVLLLFAACGLFLYKKKNKTNEDFLRVIINSINSVRYGKLTEKIDAERVDGVFKTLAESINRMIDTLIDRENMIREYDKIMSDKNKSLEQLVKREHDTHKLRQDFIATLGHDLKVPILAEANTLDFFMEGVFGELTPKQKEVIIKMKNSNTELIELVETILATYKSEEQNLIMDKSKVNLKELVYSVVDELQSVAAKSEQIIEIIANDDIEIELDVFQIKRVLKNLLFNALSYGAQSSNVIIALSKEDIYAVIKVTDFGPGIEAENIEHIFEKYYSCAKKFRKVGTGLGLYLAKQIVTAHDGTIGVQSVPYEKTEFTVKLPL